jgi:hypothetical protein
MLLKSALAQPLKHLVLNSTILSDAVLECLGSSACSIRGLESVNFAGSINFCYSGFEKLFSVGYFWAETKEQHCLHRVRELNLSSTFVDDTILKIMGKTAIFTDSIVRLSLSGCSKISDKGIYEIIRSKNFLGLQNLDLSKTHASNDTLYGIAQSSPPKRLVTLNLSHCTKMNDNGFQRLLESESARCLESLDLTGCGMESAIFTALIESKFVESLTRLNLSRCLKISEEHLQRYIASPNFRRVEALELSGTLIHNQTLQVLEENTLCVYNYVEVGLENCRHLTRRGLEKICLAMKFGAQNARRCSVKQESLSELAKSETLLKMNELALNRIEEEEELNELFRSRFAVNLNSIKICWSRMSSCFYHLATSPSISHLKEVSVKGCEIEEEGLKAFLLSENVRHLEVLDISWTQLSNRIIFTIVESKHLRFLKELRMAKCNNINDKGMEKFLRSKKCSILKRLDLRCTLLTNYTL